MSRSRSLSLAVAVLLMLAIGHDLVPHAGLHAALAQSATHQMSLQNGETFSVVGNYCAVSAQGGGATQYTFGCGAAGSSTDPAPSTTTTKRQVLQATESVLVTCNGANLQGLGQIPGGLSGSCGTPSTASPVPPTATPVQPTPVPPTPTGAPAAMHEGVPICTDHNPNKWHALVKRNPDNSINCTYLHEHRDDPNTVNDVFGPPSAWYGGNQEISYPWQTSSAAGLENNVKHQGYKWYVERDMECRPFWPAPNDGCIRDYRIQVHSLGTEADATVRFHSFSIEAIIEKDGKRGIIHHGGHFDVGHLALISDGGNGTFYCPPLASNPATFTCGEGPVRHHSSINTPEGHQDHYTYFASWYSIHRTTSISTSFEEMGPIDAQNPSVHHTFEGVPGAELVANNSRGAIGNMAVQLNFPWLASFTSNGRVTIQGYTDRGGEPVTGTAPGIEGAPPCSTPGPDCVPIKVEGAPPGLFIWNFGHQHRLAEGVEFPQVDHDVMSPQTGRSLIRLPN